MPPPQWFGGRQTNSWAAESGLELPLLDRSASSDGDGGDESGSASARAEAQVAWQQTQYTAGLVLLSGAFIIGGGNDYWYDHVAYYTRQDDKIAGGDEDSQDDEKGPQSKAAHTDVAAKP